MNRLLVIILAVWQMSLSAQQRFTGDISYTIVVSENYKTSSSIAISDKWVMIKSTGDKSHRFLYLPENDSLLVLTNSSMGEHAYITDYKLLLDFVKKQLPKNKINSYSSTQSLSKTEEKKKIGQLTATLYKNEKTECYAAPLQFSFKKILPLLLLVDGWAKYDVGNDFILSFSKDDAATATVTEMPLRSEDVQKSLNNVKVISLVRMQQDAKNDKKLAEILKTILAL